MFNLLLVLFLILTSLEIVTKYLLNPLGEYILDHYYFWR